MIHGSITTWGQRADSNRKILPDDSHMPSLPYPQLSLPTVTQTVLLHPPSPHSHSDILLLVPQIKNLEGIQKAASIYFMKAVILSETGC